MCGTEGDSTHGASSRSGAVVRRQEPERAGRVGWFSRAALGGPAPLCGEPRRRICGDFAADPIDDAGDHHRACASHSSHRVTSVPSSVASNANRIATPRRPDW